MAAYTLFLGLPSGEAVLNSKERRKNPDASFPSCASLANIEAVNHAAFICGSSTVKVEPAPGVLSTLTRPPMPSTMVLTM